MDFTAGVWGSRFKIDSSKTLEVFGPTLLDVTE
jgi:hypothetical protein